MVELSSEQSLPYIFKTSRLDNYKSLEDLSISCPGRCIPR